MRASEPTQDEIDRLVSTHLRVSKHTDEKSGPHVVADCPSCGKEKHFYVNTATGAWDCKRCGAEGGFWKLADLVGVRVRDPSMVRSPMSVMLAQRRNAESGPRSSLPPKPVANGPNLDLAKVTAGCERVFAEGDEHGAQVLAYLRGRGFNEETIRRFRLGVCSMSTKGDGGEWEREVAVSIPYVEDGKVPLVKMRNLATEKDKRRFMRTKGGDSRLFNADAVRDAKRAVLVEGELDAVSLHQAGITTVASTSLGAKKSIPPEWLAILENVDEVVLWYDDDEAGQESVHAVVHELGTWRVKLAAIDPATSDAVRAKTGKAPKDANDLLRAGVDIAVIRAIVDSSLPIDNSVIVTMDRYADSLGSVVEKADESLGVPTGLSVLDDTVRGWRDPELIMVTGHTSHGKSTAIADRLAWLAESRDEPVLMSAFENGPLMLARKIFQRRYGAPISGIRTDADRERAYEVISTLHRSPIHVIDVYGRIELSALVDHITYSRRRHGTKRVMLDHLGYILPRRERRDQREAMDDILIELTELTRKVGVTIFLIAHPRGEVEQNVIPTGDSIKGTSSAKQLADTGITIWRNQANAGDKTVRKLNLRDSLGRRMEVDMGGDESLIYTWKARHDEAKEGHGVVRYDGRRLMLTDRPDAVPQSDDPLLPKEADHQQVMQLEDDPFR